MKVARENRTVYFHTCEEFGDNSNAFLKFVPVNNLQESIDSLASRFNRNTIGIHIRRTDQELSIQKSPLSLFIRTMEQEMEVLKGLSEQIPYISFEFMEPENSKLAKDCLLEEELFSQPY